MNLDERKYYSSFGTLTSHEFYRNGKLEGERKIWYSDGALWQKEFFRDGKLEGIRRLWHRNGRLSTIDAYLHGLKGGRLGYWYDNGYPDMSGYYRAGYREGCFKFWCPNGAIYAHVIYKNGKIVKQYRYFPGNVESIEWGIRIDLSDYSAKTKYDFSFQKRQILLRLKTKLYEMGAKKYQIISSFLIADLFRLRFF